MCYDLIGSYTCKCLAGYHGHNCQLKFEAEQATPSDVTTHEPCIKKTTPTECPVCPTAVESSSAVNAAAPDPENNVATQETTTSCPIPEPEVDYCGIDPCDNGGICHNTTRGRVCVCIDSFTGDSCETG